MTKVILFDMGGVLLGLHKERCLAAFRSIGMDSFEEMLDPFHQKGLLGDMEQGLVSADEFCAECVKMSNPGTTAEDIRSSFLSFVSPVSEEKVRLVEELSKHYPLGILSNNNPIVAPWFDTLGDAYGVDFRKVFKYRFYSFELGIMKPDPRIFHLVTDRCGVRPEEILFLDDSPVNVDAALTHGIRAVHYPLEEDLAAYVYGNL